MMKKNNFLLATGIFMLVFFSMCSLNAQFKKNGSGKIVKEIRHTGNFNSINVSGGIDVYIRQADAFSVTVEVDNNLQEAIKTVVKDSILFISSDSWVKLRKNAKVYISFTNLNAITATGGSDVFTEGPFITGEFKLKLSGGSDAKINIQAIDVKIESSGGSDVYLNGAVGYLVANASGGSDIKAFDCVIAKAQVNASGGSDIFLNVQDEVSMTASGASDIKYKGTATVLKSQSSGGSDIIKE